MQARSPHDQHHHPFARRLWQGVLSGLPLLLGLCFSAAAQGVDRPRPNIVVLVADDWGFSDVGAFGGEIATPQLDALAKQGMRFSNFHVSASCSPTRSMLLTGVDNHLNGVGNLRESMPREHMGRPGYLGSLNRNVVTVSTLLQDSGYRTYVAGKWNVGSEPYNLPNQRGFDRSLVQGDTGSDNWEPHKRYLDLTDKVFWFEDGQEATMPAEFYSSQFHVDRIIDYIRAGIRSDQVGKARKPFFAYVGFQANHIPVQAPREYIDRYRGVYKDGWTALRQARRDRAAALGLVPKDTPMVTMSTTQDWHALSATEQAYEARRMEVYAGMAEAMDHHVGRLIDTLKASGEYDNTVFVFLSDNGAEASDPYAITLGRWWLDYHYKRDIDSMGTKGAYGVIGPSWASAAASPLSSYKFFSGEGGIRVPLIISGVPGMAASSIQHSFAHVTDIVPTLLDLAQVQHPGKRYRDTLIEPLNGASLLPVLRGEAQAAHPADQAIGHELSGNQAVFKGDLKLVRNLPPVSDGQWHLYDIRRDPGETRDLQHDMPAEFKAMQTDYEVYARAHGVLPMPEGYNPQQQVMINALLNVYLPRYRNAGLMLLGALVVAVLVWRRRRRPAGTAA